MPAGRIGDEHPCDFVDDNHFAVMRAGLGFEFFDGL
jgi:hypothetical protein